MQQSVFETIRNFNEELTPSERVELLTESVTTDSTYGTNIYRLFDGLLQLFLDLGLTGEQPEKDFNQFRFIHAYPDMAKDDGANVVTYSVIKRSPLKTQNNSINSRSVTKSKATYVAEKYNTVTGSVDDFYKLEFDNIISITVFSHKTKILNNLARLIESIFIKYSSFIKQFVDETVYLGMDSIRFLDRYDEQRPVYARELQFKVITTEVFKQEREHVKSIDIQIK